MEPYETGYGVVVDSACESSGSCSLVLEAPRTASSSSSMPWSWKSSMDHGGGEGLAWAVAITCLRYSSGRSTAWRLMSSRVRKSR